MLLALLIGFTILDIVLSVILHRKLNTAFKKDITIILKVKDITHVDAILMFVVLLTIRLGTFYVIRHHGHEFQNQLLGHVVYSVLEFLFVRTQIKKINDYFNEKNI